MFLHPQDEKGSNDDLDTEVADSGVQCVMRIDCDYIPSRASRSWRYSCLDAGFNTWCPAELSFGRTIGTLPPFTKGSRLPTNALSS